MQKSRWILLSLLFVACSYHAEVSCMDALAVKQMTEETALLVPEESQERMSTQALAKQGTKDHKKCLRCCGEYTDQCQEYCDLSCCKGCYRITLYSAIGVVCLGSVGLVAYVIYLTIQQ